MREWLCYWCGRRWVTSLRRSGCMCRPAGYWLRSHDRSDALVQTGGPR